MRRREGGGQGGREGLLGSGRAKETGRRIWVCGMVLALGLGMLALLVVIRTRADEGLGFGRREHHLGDEELVDEDSTGGGESDGSAAETLSGGEDVCQMTGGITESGESLEKVNAEGLTTKDPVEGHEELVYHSRPNDRMEIALSFDDGPHPGLTPQILRILAEYGIRATFFMVGENVGFYPEAAAAVVADGHEIGNHTFSHRRLGDLSDEELLREIKDCEEAISGISSAPLRWLRPPEGQLSRALRRVLGDSGYRIILWDVDTRDWAHTPPARITRHILDTVQPGDIILMHDFIGHHSPTPEALRQVIPALLERGYRFVTVGELVEGES